MLINCNEITVLIINTAIRPEMFFLNEYTITKKSIASHISIESAHPMPIELTPKSPRLNLVMPVVCIKKIDDITDDNPVCKKL